MHSIAIISYLNRDFGSYVGPMLFGVVYRNTYNSPLHGMNGSNMWPCIDFIPPLPPLRRRIPGRPKVNRRNDPSERSIRHIVSKVGRKILCNVCKQVGHNKVTCPYVEKPKQVYKPKKLKVKRKKSSSKDVKGGKEVVV